MEAVTDFLSLASKITMDCDCIHEIKTITSWQESYDKPRQCFKSKNLTLLTEIYTAKSILFLVVMYACKSWTDNKEGRVLKNVCSRTVVL